MWERRTGEEGKNQGELLYVSHLSNWEGWAAGDGSFNETKQFWRAKSRGEAKKPSEWPEGRSGGPLGLESLLFEAVGLSELAWAEGAIKNRVQDQNPEEFKERGELNVSLR